MNARGPTLWLALFSAACVVALVVLDQGHLGPGPLTTTHGSVAALSGRKGCEVCHPAGERSLADACGDCHVEIVDQLTGGFGLHGTLPSGTPSSCGECHPEHHGDELELSGSRAFRLAGLTGPGGFGHERLGFALGGTHLELECAACHAEADTHPLPEGKTRFLGLGSECTTCHEDPHGDALGQDCAACHGERSSFPSVAAFAHPSSFPLIGAHGKPGCVDCHATEGPHAISALLSGAATLDSNCVDCHPSPHGEGFVAAVQATLKTDLDGSCLACHDPEHSFGEPDASAARRLHVHTGFRLEGPHGGLECRACHGSPDDGASDDGASDDGGVEFGARFPGRSFSECSACHRDPHGGQFEGDGGPQRFCLDCHTPHGFRPSRIDGDLHASLGFPLLGAHRSLECGACHVAAESGEAVQFRGTPTACAVCHDDVHSGFFATQVPGDLRDRASDCSTCHLPDAFTPAGTTGASQDPLEAVAGFAFDHGTWTAFELRGAHGGADCKACHPSGSGPSGAGRDRGWSRDFFGYEGPSPACGDCHLDVHGGRFEGATGAPGEPPGPPACDVCHDEDAFGGEGTRGFDHGAWTGFELSGAHGRIRCESCHGAGDFASTQAWTPGRSLGFVEQTFGASPQGCASCHVDPHGGRFDRPDLPAEVDGRRSCERCHDVEGFGVRAGSGFDHGVWTGFELEGLHRALACVACHVPGSEEAGRRESGSVPAGLGRTLGSACQDCHADPHLGQFDEPGSGTNCQSCHRSDAPFREPDFDHDLDSAFELDATHRGLDCGACHVPWELPGGQSVVRYRPLGRACVDCHDPGIGGGGR